eukprot:4893028-Ditylum_brightwellii.AAC.1
MCFNWASLLGFIGPQCQLQDPSCAQHFQVEFVMVVVIPLEAYVEEYSGLGRLCGFTRGAALVSGSKRIYRVKWCWDC